MNRLERLPDRLRQARQASGLSQEGLARATKVGHAASVSGWERGRNVPSLPNAVVIAQVLDISLDWLVGISEAGGPEDLR